MAWTERLASIRGFLDYHLFDIGSTSVTAATIISAGLVALLTLLVARLVDRALARRFEAKHIDDSRRTGALIRLTHYLVLLVGFVVAVDTLGVDLRALFAAGAVFALAISFGLQNFVQNFVAGIILLVERSVSENDVLHVEDRMVRVLQVGLRSTIVRTRDDQEIIVPNSILVQSSVTNYTLSDDLYRIRVPVGVAYDTDIPHAIEVLEAGVRDIPGVELVYGPKTLINDFGNSSIVLEVNVWTRNPWDSLVSRSHVRMLIWKALKDAGITIAFPQMDVHLDEPVVEALRPAS
jgi:small-conductance mechanosensitive channel